MKIQPLRQKLPLLKVVNNKGGVRAAAKPSPRHDVQVGLDSKASEVFAIEAEKTTAIDLDRYVPAYFVWIANKLTRGASQNYLNLFGVGAEVWRCMVLLANHGTITAQQVSQIIGMDKASVSRCFKQMVSKKLIVLELDPLDGRIRRASFTLHGRHIHDQILGIALARERALLSVLSPDDHEVLIQLLKRLHENLPAVELATQAFIAGSLAKPIHKHE